MSKKRFGRLMAVFYAAALLAALAVRTVGWLGLRQCRTADLEVTQAVQSSIRDDRTWATFGPGSLLSTDGDPQLLWTVEQPVSGLRMTVRSSKPIQDPELYYTTAPGQAFSAARRLTPIRSDPAAGVYEFQLPRAETVCCLRLDPTAAAGAFFQLQVQLNPPISAARWFCPTAAQLLALAAGPALLTLAVQELAAALKKQT